MKTLLITIALFWMVGSAWAEETSGWKYRGATDSPSVTVEAESGTCLVGGVKYISETCIVNALDATHLQVARTGCDGEKCLFTIVLLTSPCLAKMEEAMRSTEAFDKLVWLRHSNVLDMPDEEYFDG